MLFRRIMIFFKINFFKKTFRNTIRVSNSLHSGQARHFFRPDLGLNCLQRLSADDTASRQRVEVRVFTFFYLFVVKEKFLKSKFKNERIKKYKNAKINSIPKLNINRAKKCMQLHFVVLY